MVDTLDGARTQVVMGSLVQRIVETGSEIAIIDITGVPTVDTLVAQHLLKTVTAIRLMGTECIVSEIRPQLAETIVHLGVDLQGVTTKANLADARAIALTRTGFKVRLAKSAHEALDEIAVARMPAVAISASTRDADRDRAIGAGFQAHLAKPLQPDVLLTTVARPSGMPRD